MGIEANPESVYYNKNAKQKHWSWNLTKLSKQNNYGLINGYECDMGSIIASEATKGCYASQAMLNLISHE